MAETTQIPATAAEQSNTTAAVAPEPTSSVDQTQSLASSAPSLETANTSTINGTPAASSSTTISNSKDEEEWVAPKDGPLKTPISRPMKAVKPAVPVVLTSEQQEKYAIVLASVLDWKMLPATSARGAEQTPLQEHEQMWLTRDCLLRYLRATKWNTANALKRLQATLTWRREYGADAFTADYISPENETGKLLLLGFDNNARPCLYLQPGKQNTKISDRQIHHLSYMLDRMVDMMPPGQESACLLINYKGAATANVPSVSQGRAVLNILQGHSPERLGKALINEVPWYVHTFFKLISPFIDPVTKEKMKFNEDLKKYVPPPQLWKAQGGELDFEYDHEKYWPALTQECESRRKAYRERWESAGKRIGEYEIYLRGGDHPSLSKLSETAGLKGEADQDSHALAVELAKLSV